MVARTHPAPTRSPTLLETVKGNVTVAMSVPGVVKHYGATRALNHPGLSVWTGERRGFPGPSGAWRYKRANTVGRVSSHRGVG